MALKNLTNKQRLMLARQLGTSQSQSKWNRYYSRVRLAATSQVFPVGGGNIYSIPKGQIVKAFGYGRGGDMAAAGLPGVVATIADTNIQQPNQTNAGEIVLIEGVSMFMLSTSDANFAKQLDPSVSVVLETNGTTRYLLGIPSMIPGCGGLFGNAEAQSTAPSLQDSVSRGIGVITNGIPHASNFMPLPEPMLWNSAGRGDSTINISLTTEASVSTIATYGTASRAPAAAIQAYLAPLAAAVFVDFLVVFVGCTVNPLSTY
jgi:hypothetical protein